MVISYVGLAVALVQALAQKAIFFELAVLLKAWGLAVDLMAYLAFFIIPG
jgi:hypothetical protein